LISNFYQMGWYEWLILIAPHVSLWIIGSVLFIEDWMLVEIYKERE